MQNRLSDLTIWASSGSLIVLCDSEGKVLDHYYEMAKNPHPRLFELLIDMITKAGNIFSLFSIPLKAFEARNDGTLSFPNLMSVQKAMPGKIEIYSRIRFFNCTLKRISHDRFLCRIRLATSIQRIISESWVKGMFCVDDQEKLQCFNLLFASAFAHRFPKPESLLGRSLSELLSPTPFQAQEEWKRNLPPPDPGDFKTVLDLNAAKPETLALSESGASVEGGFILLHSESDRGTYIPLPFKHDWPSTDFMLSIHADEGTDPWPCLTILEAENDFPDYADREHLLVGPGGPGQGFLLKRRGDLLHQENAPNPPVSGRTLRFFRLNGGFVVDLDGRPLLTHLIHEDSVRGRAELALFVRPGATHRLRRITLSIRPDRSGRRMRNLIASVRGREDLFLLLSIHLRFNAPGSRDSLSAFRVHDLSDIRGELLALKEGYDASLRREKDMSHLLSELKEDSDAWIGDSSAARVVYEQATRLAKSGVTLLITGPTGAGKEVLARRIHAQSEFSQGPFVKVDCSTLPPTLMESLLFGHEKGAFTGATEKRKGLFEQAQGGTLFLDEIGNVTLEVQAKLLRFLQDFSFTAVGDDRPRRLHLRVIAATNAALDRKIHKGEFREDLYYRLAVGLLRLPALRERIEDLPVLVRHFTDLFNLKHGKNIEGLTAGALRMLTSHPWPGNIRELKNLIERAHLFCTGPVIDESLLQFAEFQDNASDRSTVRDGRKPHVHLRGGEDAVRQALRECGGVVSRAARRLNVSRPALYLFLSEHGIRPALFRSQGPAKTGPR